MEQRSQILLDLIVKSYSFVPNSSKAKIFSMEIPEIKTQLSLAQVFDHYGLKPDKHGKMNCPFHDDKTPSFQVYWKTL